MPPVLTIDHLHKRYGKIHAVNDLSLEVDEGSVFGILGPNGSGKTTTLGMLLSVIRPDAGSFTWFGQSAESPRGLADSRQQIGAILEAPIFYPYLSAVENLKIVAQIKGCRYERIDEVLRTVDLAERQHDKFKTYSLGMKQRLAIASALLADPRVMILDEPTNGLDPQGIAEIRSLIVRIAEQGKTIILASHLLDEVQRVCTHFAVLRRGKRIYAGRVDEALAGTDTVEVAAADMEQLQQLTQQFPFTQQIQRDNGVLRVHLPTDKSSADLNRFLIEQGVVVSHLAQRTKSLEQQFLELLATSESADHD